MMMNEKENQEMQAKPEKEAGKRKLSKSPKKEKKPRAPKPEKKAKEPRTKRVKESKPEKKAKESWLKKAKEPEAMGASQEGKKAARPKLGRKDKQMKAAKQTKRDRKTKSPNMRELPFYRGIGMKLIASFFVPIVCIIVLGLASYKQASNAITTSYRDSSEQTIDMMQQYLKLILSTEREEFKSYLGEQDLTFYYKGMFDKMEAIQAKNKYVDMVRDKMARDSKLGGVYFLSDEGKSIYTVNRQVVDDSFTQFSNSALGQTVLAAPYDWHTAGQDVEMDTMVNIDTSTYALRLLRKLNDIPQVMIIDISASTVRTALESLDPGEGGYVLLVTGNGAEFFSDPGVEREEPLVFGRDFYTEAMEAEEMSGSRNVNIDGEEYLFAYNKLEGCDAMLAGLIHSKTVLNQTANIRNLSITLTIVATIIAMLLGFFMSQSISKTIQNIMHELRKVAKGNLTVHMKSKRKDELGLLCEGVNDTVDNMKKLIVKVNEISQQVGESAAYVAVASSTFMETSQDIRNAVSEIEIGVHKLDSGSGDCLNQMDSLSDKINNVSSNANEIERLTNATGDTINTGISSVQGLTESAESTAQITRHVISSIEELETKSKSIGNIVSVINEIAEQTNLLSLNASIEAARAGEAGRGFAVVAEEIRKLADQCLASASQINSIVDEIVSQTGDVVEIAKQAENAVSSQSGVVEETTSSFRQIDDQVEQLLHALETIASNVQEMNGARNETLNAIESISAVSTETAAGSSSVYDAAGTQLEAIEELDNASKQLAGKADNLLELLATFQV